MSVRQPQVITTRQAKRQIGHFGRSLVLYIVFFLLLNYGLSWVVEHYPGIYQNLDPESVNLGASILFMLLITFIAFTISAKSLHLNMADYYTRPKIGAAKMFSLVCIGLGIELIITSVSSLFYFFFHTNSTMYDWLGVFTTKDYVIRNILYFLLIVILKPVCDEYIFRGIIQRQLGHYGRYFGVLGSAVLYAIAQWNLVQAIPALLIGWYLSLITLRYHSVRPAMAIQIWIALFSWALNVVPSKYIWIFTIIIIAVYIVAGLSIFQKQVDTHIARTGATEPKLWKILFTTPSIILCVCLFGVNVVLSLM